MMAMSWTPYHTALRDALVSLFPDREDIRSLLDEAQVPIGLVALGNRAVSNWHESIREAVNRGKLEALVSSALARYPENPVLLLLQKGSLPKEAPGVLDWRGAGADQPSLEKITGIRNTLLPISFLERGVRAARSVARIRIPKGAGTGFLIAGDLLVTNNHVLSREADAESASVDFNFQETMEGIPADVDTFALAPTDAFATSQEHDWTVVRVKEKDGRRVSAKWGQLELTDSKVSIDDPVNIVQHPLGGQKHVGLYHNHVAFVDQNVIQYLTDTQPGSSGSPVFNDAWQVVAVHHAGRSVHDPKGKAPFIRNEGVRAVVLLEALGKLGLLPPGNQH
jgi:V8-like Glu-specific endopeptidase